MNSDYRINEIDEQISALMRKRYDILTRLDNTVKTSSNHKIVDLINNALSKNLDISNKKIGCQGVDGSYSSMACSEMFGDTDVTFFPAFEDVFKAVENGDIFFGILPIENSTAGSVISVYDLMQKYNFYIYKTTKIKIEHCLLTKDNVALDEITDVYSHEHAINQCQEFLRNYPNIKVHSSPNTAIAAKMVADSCDKNIAAIASTKCSQLYKLNVLQHNIQDTKTNSTRFVCITKDLYITENANKISLSLSLPHVKGSLSDLLNKFAINGVNLSKIESRPLPNKDFEFLFYFDFFANVKNENVINMLSYLEDTLDYFAFLGNYFEN